MIKTVSISLLVALFATTVQAQEAPAPRRMPRVPVSRELLAGTHEPMPASREKQGLASIIDGEKLRIDGTSLRLFGIVPPQLAASFGPQARAELDALAAGQSVSCQIRDRDREGWLLATCLNAGGNDMALELLKRGLAVVARGSIAGTELAVSYPAAEQAAQNQKIGLWSALVSAAAVSTPAAAPLPQPKAESPAPPVVAEAKKEEKTTLRTDAQTQAKIAADILSQQAQMQLDEMSGMVGDEGGFFERYQILMAGFLMLATALSILGVLGAQKSRERREEIKGLAAALRGELMAARNVCAGRAKSIASDTEDRIAVWPRIRSTLYQAYVGRLGFLGAELARLVASIYGQSSDYAAFYSPTAGVSHDVPKKQAMETLIKRIDEVLPRLAEIERTGTIATAVHVRAPFHRRIDAETTMAYQAAMDDPVALSSALHAEAFRASGSLLDGVGGFLRSCRDAMVPAPSLPPTPVDPHVAEYAAIIEADMARYQYEENGEPPEVTPQKKRG